MKLCKCGCGQEVILKRHHKWAGIPDFVHGHNSRGILVSQKTRKLLSEQKRGEKNPSKRPDVRRKLSEKALMNWKTQGYKEMHSGENAPMFGKHQTDESREKSRLAMLGEKNPSWRGGISKLPYTQDWTADLKDAIRKRDDYSCQLCGVHQWDLKEKLHVHHVDYNKENCNPKNLTSLCRSCHMKTNARRTEWKVFFSVFCEEYAKERMVINA